MYLGGYYKVITDIWITKNTKWIKQSQNKTFVIKKSMKAYLTIVIFLADHEVLQWRQMQACILAYCSSRVLMYPEIKPSRILLSCSPHTEMNLLLYVTNKTPWDTWQCMKMMDYTGLFKMFTLIMAFCLKCRGFVYSTTAMVCNSLLVVRNSVLVLLCAWCQAVNSTQLCST